MTDAERGLEALNAKKYEEAVEFLSNAIPKSRGLPLYSLYIQRAMAFLGLKLFTKGLHDATKAVEINPTGGEGYLFLGRIFYTLGEFEKSLTYYNIANLNNSGTNPQFASQVQSALKNIANDYQDVKELVTKGRQALDIGDFKGAQNAFTEVIKRKPNVWVYYYYRSLSDIGLKQEKQARQDAMKITEFFPEWPKCECLKSGYIQKEGEVNMVHQKRKFYLKSLFLYYFDEKSPDKPKGVIVCYNIQCAKREGGKLFQLETKDRKYFLKAANAEDGMEWLTLINQTRKSTITLPKYATPDERVTNQAQNKRQSMHGSLPGFTDLETIIDQPYSSSAQMMNAIQNEPKQQNAKSASFHTIPSLPPPSQPSYSQGYDDNNIASYGNHSNRLSLSGSSDRVPSRANTLNSSGETPLYKSPQVPLDIDALRDEQPKISKPSASLGSIPNISNTSAFSAAPQSRGSVYAPSTTTSSYAASNGNGYSAPKDISGNSYSTTKENSYTAPMGNSYSATKENSYTAPSGNSFKETSYTAPVNNNYSGARDNGNSAYGALTPSSSLAPSNSVARSRESSRDERLFSAPAPAVSKNTNENTPLMNQTSSSGSIPGSTAQHRRVVGIKHEEEPERGCCESCSVM